MKSKFLLTIIIAFGSFIVRAQDGELRTSVSLENPKFSGTVESLKQYECPEWFRDAKFGIYIHWGAYSVAEMGEWYPRRLYMEDTEEWWYHKAHYGDPTKVGYETLIPLWKAEKFNPDSLVALFKEAGAKYFTPCAVHHDNFDLWDSKYQKWNSVNMGPKKDITRMWKDAADKAGLRWGVTTHLSRSYSWLNTANQSAKGGFFIGVPYDGAQGKGKGLYPPNDGQSITMWGPENPPAWWKENWFNRIQQLIDDYDPDLLYFDGSIPFQGEDKSKTGLELMAYYYNTRPEGVINYKKRNSGLYVEGIGTEDFERSAKVVMRKDPWQVDDSMGPWGYKKGVSYQPAGQIVGKLIDIVSHNGNLLLNVPPRADGTLDAEATQILKNIGKWMAINGEGVYGTRPWYIGSEGENEIASQEGKFKATSKDIRFTTKGNLLYAFVMNWPNDNEPVVIKTLGSNNPKAGEINSVQLLGFSKKLKWKQKPEGLYVNFPKKRIGEYVYTLKLLID